MYVTKRGDKFRAWERIVVDGKVHKISVTMDRDTPQSRKKAAALLSKKAIKTDSGMRYADLVAKYIEYQKATAKMSTWTRNEATLNRLEDTFRNAKLENMTAGFISSHLLKLTAEPTTYNEYLKRIKALFRWAYRQDYIPSSACVDKIQPLKNDEVKRTADKFLEVDELKKIMQGTTEYYSLVFEFLALSGLRIGELIALNDEDITDTDIIVRKTYDPRNNVINTPKTPAGWRAVHIQPELANCIDRIRTMSNLHREISRKNAPYFVVNINGGRLSYFATERRFRALCVALTGKELSVHALRHTHVALMSEQGIDLDAIARRCGHSNSRITKEIYYHVTKKQKSKDDAAFDSAAIFA